METFSISYEINSVNCALPSDESNGSFEGFLEDVLIGDVTIGGGSSDLKFSCGLLRLSRSLIGLCTFPALYGEEATGFVLDVDVNFHSVVQNGNIVLTIDSPTLRSRNVFELPLEKILGIVGKFHKELLLDLNRLCPEIRNYGSLLVKIPDAFYTITSFNARNLAR